MIQEKVLLKKELVKLAFIFFLPRRFTSIEILSESMKKYKVTAFYGTEKLIL